MSGAKSALTLNTSRKSSVLRMEQGVQRRRPDKHDLYVEGHGLRAQRGGGDRAGLLGQVLDAHLASQQRPLERLPGERLAQHVGRVQHEKAAAGAVQPPARIWRKSVSTAPNEER